MLNLIWRNIWYRRTLSLLTILSVSLTAALIVFLLLTKAGLEEGAAKGYGPFEVIVGADGSETQLVLNSLYHVGAPTGNVPHAVLEQLQAEQDVDAALGMTTGDHYNGYPIVGIEPRYFPVRYGDRSLEAGRLYSKLGEVVVGSHIAETLGLKVGDTFHGGHGLVDHGAAGSMEHAEEDGHAEESGHAGEAGHSGEAGHAEEAGHGVEAGHAAETGQAEKTGNAVEAEHGEEAGHGNEAGHDEETELHESFIYTVVGVLPPLNSADDRAVFTTIDYAWAVHHNEAGEAREVTAVLVKPKSLGGMQALKTKYDGINNTQAVFTSKVAADVVNLVDRGSEFISVVTLLCILLATISIALSLAAAVHEKQKDVGLLRLIGKPASFIWMLLIGEGLLITGIGLVLGLILGHLGSYLGSSAMFEFSGIRVDAWSVQLTEVYLIAGTLVVGLLASVGPAYRVYRVETLQLFRS